MISKRRARLAKTVMWLITASTLVAVFQIIRLRPQQHLLAALKLRRDSAEDQLMQQERDKAMAEIRRVGLQNRTARVRPEAATATAVSPETAKLLRDNPGLAAKLLHAEKSRIAIAYGRFFRAAQLSTEQQEQVTALLAARAVDSAKAGAALPTRADRLSDDAALASLLGPARSAQLSDYESTLGIRAIVTQLASNIYYSAHPLSADEADRLTTALATAVPVGSPGDPLLGSGLPSGIDWNEALSEAANVLIPDQLATFQLIAEVNRNGRMN